MVVRVLFVTLMFPDPHAHHASAFTVFRTIEHLSRRHDVSLLSFVRDDDERKRSDGLRDCCTAIETVVVPSGVLRKIRVRMGLLAGTPISVANSFSREMAARVRSMCQHGNFDVVQLEYSPMAQYATAAAHRQPVIVSVHDVLSSVARQMSRQITLSRQKVEWYADRLVMSAHERRLYSQCDHVVAVSESVKTELLALDDRLSISVVRPGVDVATEPKQHAAAAGRNLVFMGAMWRRENVETVLHLYHSIFGAIRKACPDAMLHIVGGSPTDEVKRLASDPAVRVTGYVEDLPGYYRGCDVSVAPMRLVGGVMCKILDAMAAGLPVVTTPEGNAGIGATPGREILIATSPESFADHTIALLKDGRRRAEIGRGGLEFVRREFSWAESIRRLERVYAECAGRGHSADSPAGRGAGR